MLEKGREILVNRLNDQTGICVSALRGSDSFRRRIGRDLGVAKPQLGTDDVEGGPDRGRIRGESCLVVAQGLLVVAPQTPCFASEVVHICCIGAERHRRFRSLIGLCFVPERYQHRG